MTKLTNNWLKLAEYDLKTAGYMLSTGRYLYVAFTCQQCIEKSLKAIYLKEHKNTPPYTHNLLRLTELTSVKLKLSEEDLNFIPTLNTYYIESRYTEEIQEILKMLNKKTAGFLYAKTRKLFLCLKKQI